MKSSTQASVATITSRVSPMLCHMARPGGADGTRTGPAAAAAPLLLLLPPRIDPAARRGWAAGASPGARGARDGWEL